MKPSTKVRKTSTRLKKAYSTRRRARRAVADARRQASFDAAAYETLADPWTTRP